MKQIIIDAIVSIIAAAAAFALSWPFWRTFEYWAESQLMWWVYFVVGYVFSVYVLFIFIRCMHTLFLHDALLKSGNLPKSYSDDKDKEEVK